VRFVDVLYSYLSAYAGLVALVGDAIHPNVVPQDTPPPYVAMDETNRNKIYTHGGYCGSSIFTYQLSSYAVTKDAVELIAQQIANAMAAWRASSVNIGFAIEIAESDAYEVEPDLYRIDLDYRIFYNE